MSFELALRDGIGASVRSVLNDLVGAAAIRESADGVVVSVIDQAELVGLIDRLHDLGVVLGEVRAAPSNGPARRAV